MSGAKDQNGDPSAGANQQRLASMGSTQMKMIYTCCTSGLFYQTPAADAHERDGNPEPAHHDVLGGELDSSVGVARPTSSRMPETNDPIPIETPRPAPTNSTITVG